ncbi:CBS domain-containing protein [Halorubrum laminariae]|uniref:Cyclic nucleotide-binding/CBS domain-containing protein n=1 Tax=Halorubrum laminariae TaxID=1433523 RepID=A0ABD6BY27_9EURY|nr:CBS domain-containing protein [Halorubrum laminariae]
MRTDTTVRDVMHREFLGASESDSLAAAAELMVAEETDCLVVVRGGEPVGRLACRDALGALLEAGAADGDRDAAETRTVGSVMGPPLPTVAPDDALSAVEERLVTEGVDRVVAVEGGEAIGVVTAADAIAASASRNGGPQGSTVSDRPTNGSRQTARDARARSPDADVGTDNAVDRPAANADESATQGVCEACGALVPNLVTANGQAVCPECREA